MRVLGNIPVPKENDINYPFGSSLKNETATEQGTPVIEEIYADVLNNIYKVLELTNVTPTDTKDRNDTQYQFVEALKKLPNLINDSEKVLTLNGLVWEVDLDLSTLPDKFIFFARPDSDSNGAVTYTFKGSGVTTLPFNSVSFSSGDFLIVVIDSLGVRCYPLTTNNSTAKEEIATTITTPMAFNDSSVLYYETNGRAYNDDPKSINCQSLIRTAEGDGTLIVNEINITNGFILCAVTKPSDVNYYEIFKFDINSPVIPTKLTKVGATQLVGTNNPYIYLDGLDLYATNEGGNDALENKLSKFTLDLVSDTITFVSTISLTLFSKTTNAAIKGTKLYTMVSGDLNNYSLTTGSNSLTGSFPTTNLHLFKFNGSLYFGSGQVAKIWKI